MNEHTGYIEIIEENPFENCKFAREKIADNLTNIIQKTEHPLVLSVDSPWGTGKTTFVNMWKQKLENTGEYKTLYFNAWENDDSDDPLLSLLSVMLESFPEKSKEDTPLGKVKKAGKTLLKKGLPLLFKILTRNALDLDEIELDNYTEKQLTEFAGKLGELEFKKHRQEKEMKAKFKTALEEYQKSEKKKVIFFIDELDRCRPNYAIETLERVKHLFSIDNYIFVLALDKSQLSHSVATLYGEKMDAMGYLRRFIDLDYMLPTPDKNLYIDYKVADIISATETASKVFWNKIKEFSELFEFSLRDIDKLAYYLRIFLSSFDIFETRISVEPIGVFSISSIASFLITLKLKKPNEYKIFLNKNYIEKDLFNTMNWVNIKFINPGYNGVEFNDSFEDIMLTFIKLYNNFDNQISDDAEYDIQLPDKQYPEINLKSLLTSSGKINLIDQIDFIDNFRF